MRSAPELLFFATAMRCALEAVPRGRLPIGLQAFPRGACGDSTLIMGAYLVDLGEQGFQYVCGERGIPNEPGWTSHAWLARGDLVIDITADQFADAPQGVIVSNPSTWHRCFEINHVHAESDIRQWHGSPDVEHCITLYRSLDLPLSRPR